MSTTATTFLLVTMLLLAGCLKSLDAESELTSEELRLAMLTIADRMMLRYLERHRKARIEHVIDPAHDHGDLKPSAVLVSAYGEKKYIQVRWQRVQADSVQVLRCMKEDLEEGGKSKINKVCQDIANLDFAKLTQEEEANKCGYLNCRLVKGEVIDDTRLIDKEARNKAEYHYHVKPCYDNYLLVAHGKNAPPQTCGAQQIKALTQKTTSKGTGVVQRVCNSNKALVCSRASPPAKIDFHLGEEDLPIELFEQMAELLKKIKKLEEGIVINAQRGLKKIIKAKELEKEYTEKVNKTPSCEQAELQSMN